MKEFFKPTLWKIFVALMVSLILLLTLVFMTPIPIIDTILESTGFGCMTCGFTHYEVTLPQLFSGIHVQMWGSSYTVGLSPTASNSLFVQFNYFTVTGYILILLILIFSYLISCFLSVIFLNVKQKKPHPAKSKK